MIVGGYHVGPLLRSTGKEILEDKVPVLAAQAAYFFFFSLFPLLLFLTPLVGLLMDEQTVLRYIETQLRTVAGEQAVAPVRAVIENVFVDDAPGLISVGALLAAWAGSNIFGAMMNALNVAYDVEEERAFWKKLLVRLGMFVIAIVIIVSATIILLAGDDIARWVGGLVGLSDTAVRVWTLAQLPLAFAFVVLFTFMTFYVLPNARQDWRPVLVTAVITTVVWVIATLAFRLYVQNFADFNRMYGTIGGIIALLMWMYITMFVVLSGGELASELAHGTGAVRPRKGAVYHGRIVSAAGPADSSMARSYGAHPPGEDRETRG